MATKAKYIQQKEVIAIDYVALYKALVESGDIPTIRSQAAFSRAWDATQSECLLFTAANLADNEGFVDSIIMQLLEVAAVYLHLDPWQAPTALGFGLFLVSYLYFTQPSVLPPLPASVVEVRGPNPHPSSSSTTASSGTDRPNAVDESRRPRRRHKIRVGVDAYRTMLERIPSLPNHELLRHVLASLVMEDAFIISPHVDNGPAITAIVTAHSLFESPLIDLKRLKKETAMLSKQIKKDIGEIERRISQLGSSSAQAEDKDEDDLRSALLAAISVGTSESPSSLSTSTTATSSDGKAFLEPPDFGTDRAAMRSILVKKDQYLQMRKGLL